MKHNWKMRLILSTILFAVAAAAWSQHTIEGRVLSMQDSLPIPEAFILVDSRIQTRADSAGNFSIKVDGLPATLEFAFVMYVTRTYIVSSDTNITVYMKHRTTVDYFGSQKIGFAAVSDLINTPLGGELHFSTPYFFDRFFIASTVGYQTNLDDNRITNGALSLAATAFTLNANYLEAEIGNEIYFIQRSIDVALNYPSIPVDLALGYSRLDLGEGNKDSRNYDGLIIGLSKYIEPLSLTASARIAIYNRLNAYRAAIHRRFNRIHTFVRYRKLASFEELGIGFGYRITYLLDDPNKY